MGGVKTVEDPSEEESPERQGTYTGFEVCMCNMGYLCQQNENEYMGVN